jgi:hypothetical protein
MGSRVSIIACYVLGSIVVTPVVVRAQPSPWTLEGGPLETLGRDVAGCGDYDGDSDDEILISSGAIAAGGAASFFLGSSSGPTLPAIWTAEGGNPGDGFGRSLACAGDANGDGINDLLIGANGFDGPGNASGKAFLFLGIASAAPSTTAIWEVTGTQTNSQFGFSVAGAVDVNDDGFDDLIVSARGDSNGENLEGRVFVYYGTSNGPPLNPNIVFESNRIDARFGYSVAGLGDVNGDGFDDIALSSTWYDGAPAGGRVFAYYGSINGLNANPHWQAVEPPDVISSPEFGFCVSRAGDVNGDGFDDFIVGGPYHSVTQQEEGIAVLYLGSPAGLGMNPAWVVSSHHHLLNGARFGWSVSDAGDYNGDGFDDVIVGAPYYSAGISQQGAAFIYLGSPSGLNRFPARIFTGEEIDSQFGFRVARAGDVNDDGMADILVGSPQYGPEREGKVYVFYGEAIRPIFFDGFESGNLSEWSAAVP